MADDTRVQLLLEEIMDSGRAAEDVCRASPELLPAVLEGLRRLRAFEAEMTAMFPAHPPKHQGSGAWTMDAGLPVIPGYTVSSVLGRGGMGVVYKARHLKLARNVAVKMLLKGDYAGPAELARFMREAQAVAVLRHPHIVQVYDIGDLDGRPYFTMEYVEGGNLAQKLAGSPQPAADAAVMVATLAEAIQVAHDAGIIHRDLKPSNILLTSDGSPKITDFGLARRYTEGPDLTIGGARLGTPSYMSPEQAIGLEGTIGPSADIYSLGAVLYEMLTGRPPFKAETPAETERQVIAEEPAPPSRLNAKVPRDLETICLKCLDKEPQRRYLAASALAADLHRFLNGEPIAARRAGPVEKVYKWARRRPSQAVISVGGALAVVSIAGVIVWASWQRAAANHAVSDDLSQVAEFERASDWTGARAALERAKGRLGDGGDHRLRRVADEAEAHLALVAVLDDIRLNRAKYSASGGGLTREESNAAYHSAFEGAQLSPNQLTPEQAAVRILASDIREALLAALDDWIICAQGEREWVANVASAVDSDPWRAQVRRAVVAVNRAELEELATDEKTRSQPVRLLMALAAGLQQAGGNPLSLLKTAQQEHPADFWTNFALGSSLATSDPGQAIGFLRSAIALRPEAALPHFDLANALLLTNQPTEAMRQFERVLELTQKDNPYYRRSFVNIGVIYQSLKKPEEAIPRFQEALRIDPSDAKTRFNLGFSLASVGRVHEAIAEYREVLKSYPNVANAHHTLAVALAHVHDEAGAIEEYEQAIRLDPKYSLSHLLLGRLYKKAGRLDQAAEQFRVVTELTPRDFDARNDLRGVLMCLGEFERVRGEWHDILASDPPEHGAWDGYAELCLFLGREGDYQRACKDLIARFGATTNPHVAECIGRACLLKPGDEEDVRSAAALVDIAINADASRSKAWAVPFFQFAKGLAEYRQNRLREAIAIMEGPASTALGPGPQLVIAMAQHRLGQVQEARHVLGLAITKGDWSSRRVDIRDTWVIHCLRREAEALILPELPAFLEGRHRPRDNDERLAFQGVCQFERRFADSARLYADAFAADPSLVDDLGQGLRFKAACAASLAGSAGQGLQPVEPGERAQWRQQAREWLLADVAKLRGMLGDVESRPRVWQVVSGWLAEPDLAGIRDEADLKELPADERGQCVSLWAEVRELQSASADEQ